MCCCGSRIAYITIYWTLYVNGSQVHHTEAFTVMCARVVGFHDIC